MLRLDVVLNHISAPTLNHAHRVEEYLPRWVLGPPIHGAHVQAHHLLTQFASFLYQFVPGFRGVTDSSASGGDVDDDVDFFSDSLNVFL